MYIKWCEYFKQTLQKIVIEDHGVYQVSCFHTQHNPTTHPLVLYIVSQA